MKKYVLDLKVVSVEALSDKHVLIKLTDEKPLPEILPGQFVEVKVEHSPTTMLRRPISINYVDRENNQLWLLVAMVGDGTRQLGQLKAGDSLNCMLPLGNGFTMPSEKSQKFLLVGGGVGVAYKPEQTPVDFKALSKGVEEAYNRILVANGLGDVALAYECGRMVTGPFGYLVSTAIHKKDIYRHYIGLDSCMANLMRPALYGSYHHITVMGKENEPKDHVYDVTGSLCENNDKFAIQRELPKIDIGDRIIIHDAGAHGHSMGFNYNGKLRSAELLLHKDGSVTQIRRAETYDDLFGTLDFSNL